MIDRIDLHPFEHAQLVGDRRQMLEAVTHPQARLANLAKAERTLDIIPPAAGHLRGEFVLPRELLHVQFGQLGLGIERVDVAWPSLHE